MSLIKDNNKNNDLKEIKSKYILKQVFDNLRTNKFLEIIRYNKNLQNILDKGINDYRKIYSSIEIILIPKKNELINGNFINIPNEENQNYYHIFFNDAIEEVKRKYIKEDENIEKIKIIVDHEIKSLSGLFKDCQCIKKIEFIKFKRNDIKDMSHMFDGCKYLEEINFSNFNTDNVKDMSFMFNECSALRKLDLSNFNTNNVEDMNNMFSFCSFLSELNLSNFKANKAKNISKMFYYCSFLKKLDLSKFNTKKYIITGNIFYYCSALKKLVCPDKKIIKLYKYLSN